MEYPFKDLLPIDEVLEREGYYKDWTHLDPKVFYSLTQISEYIKTKGYGADVRLLISQLAEHFGLSVVEVTDIANELIARQDVVETFNNQVIKEMTDKDVISAPELIEARKGEAKLSARLDKEHNEVTAQLEQKANQSYVDSKIQSVADGSPKGTFDTLAELQSAFPTGDDGNYLLQSDGHIYYWSGTEWSDTGILYQAAGIADNSVDFTKTNFLDYGENKANPYAYADGNSINSMGNLSVDASYSASDFMPVKEGITYVIYPNDTTIKRPSFYNYSKEFIENMISSTTNAPLTYTPATDGYIRLGVLTTGKMNVSVTDQSYSKEFVPFYMKGVDNLRTRPLKQSVGSEELQDKTITAKKATFFDDGHNLFEEGETFEDSFKNLSAPTIKQTSTSYVLYENVPVTGGEKLNYRAFGMGAGIRFILYFDNEDSFIDGVDFETTGARVYELSVPINATRASITVFKENTNHVLSRYIDIVEGQSNYQIKPSYIANINPQVSPLANKRLLGFGDSIGQGGGNVVNGSGYSYIEMVADDNQMTHENYSVGGATIAPREGYDNQIIKQIRLAISNGDVADYIVFNGLTNDASATPIDRIGEMTSGYTDELDLNTFAGSFEEVCRTLKLNWLGAKIIYVRVHNMSSRGTQQVLYGDMAVKICKKYSIPVVDMYSEGGLNTQITEMTNLYTNEADSTHPNALGYRTFYAPMVEAKLKSL